MKKYSLRFTKWLGVAWTVLAILVGCVAPSAEETATVQPVAATSTLPTATPLPNVTPPPTLSSTMAVETSTSESSIPLCTFAADDAPEATEASLDNYVFSEPQVVLTHTTALGIAGWLPDSEQLLLTRQLAGGYEAIEVFNVHTGVSQVYAERWGGNGKPIWLPDVEAVVYSAVFKEQVEFELWISRGDPERAERVLGDVDGISLALEPRRQQLWYSSRATGGYPQYWDMTTGPLAKPSKSKSAALPFNLAREEKPWNLQIAWRSDGTQAAFHNYSQLFLLDPETSQVCEVDLESVYGRRCAVQQGFQWSPDGRYLAMRTNIYIPHGPLIASNDLTILDTFTGDLYHPELDIQYLYDVTWSSDSQTLALLGSVDAESSHFMGIFILNVQNSSMQRVLSDQFFGGGPGSGWMLAWSPDNNSIAIKCPVWPETQSWIVEDRICIIDVNIQD